MLNLFKLFSKSRTTPPDPSGTGYFIIPAKEAGVLVNEDSAIQNSAVFSCVKYIAESISSMPWHVFKRRPDGGKDMVFGPVDWALDKQPNPETNAISWRETMIAWGLLWGNGYAEIARDYSDTPGELWQIKPDRVEVTRTNSGRLIYDVNNGSGNSNTVIEPKNMFHLRGWGDDGLVGHSVISLARKAIGLGLAAERFGSNLFANGAQPGGILSAPAKLSDKARTNLEAALKKKYTGDNAFSTMVLEEGVSFISVTIPPEDAQFLETRKFQVSEIARWFRVPPHKVMDLERSTNNNIEAQNIDSVVDCLMPWIRKLELEADIKLFGGSRRGRVFTKLNMAGLLRGDSVARSEYYQKMWSMGAINPNEIREKEDMNPIGPDGDKFLVQLNLTTLEKAGEEQAPPAQADAAFASHKSLLQNAVTRIHKREERRISDGMAKYKQQADFSLFIDNFFAQHAKFISDTIEPHVSAIMTLFKADNQAFECVQSFTRDHLARTKARALAAHSENGPMLFDIAADVDELLETMCLKGTI